MLKELYITVVLYAAVCLAIPLFDSNSRAVSEQQKKSVRVKRYGFYGGYNSYFGNSPHSVSFKTPFFKIKVKNGFPAGGYGYQPYHIHDPFGGIGYYHPQPYGLNGGFTYPHDSYHYNLHEYGWIG